MMSVWLHPDLGHPWWSPARLKCLQVRPTPQHPGRKAACWSPFLTDHRSHASLRHVYTALSTQLWFHFLNLFSPDISSPFGQRHLSSCSPMDIPWHSDMESFTASDDKESSQQPERGVIKLFVQAHVRVNWIVWKILTSAERQKSSPRPLREQSVGRVRLVPTRDCAEALLLSISMSMHCHRKTMFTALSNGWSVSLLNVLPRSRSLSRSYNLLQRFISLTWSGWVAPILLIYNMQTHSWTQFGSGFLYDWHHFHDFNQTIQFLSLTKFKHNRGLFSFKDMVSCTSLTWFWVVYPMPLIKNL
jgi:hypothetical protein